MQLLIGWMINIYPELVVFRNLPLSEGGQRLGKQHVRLRLGTHGVTHQHYPVSVARVN